MVNYRFLIGLVFRLALCALVLLCLLALALSANAETGLWVRAAPGQVPSVSLGWDYPTNELGTAGFYIYQGGASNSYTNRVQIFGAAARSGTITNIIPGRTYYFAATAFTFEALESDFSNELVYRKPVPPTLLASSMRGIFVRIAAVGQPDTLYAFERSEDLKKWEPWDIVQANGAGEFALLELPLFRSAYYRTREYP